ncbi:MAG: hypothetical protein KBF88_15125 [Polyangiaceae bacterium]|nr:hypothetical protein [Polyangiaceae bacterium]
MVQFSSSLPRFVSARSSAFVLLLLAVLPTGCAKKTLPNEFVGTFKRKEALAFGVISTHSELQVSPGGFSFRDTLALGALGVRPTQDGVALDVHGGAPSSHLFDAVECSGKTCTFKAKDGCEGSMSLDASGDLTLLGTGSCTRESGKWLGPVSARSLEGPTVHMPKLDVPGLPNLMPSAPHP